MPFVKKIVGLHMSEYIDGFLLPVANEGFEEYQRIAAEVSKLYLEHGAIEYKEFVGDDLEREGLRSFPGVINSKEGEKIVFGWAVFESREARDVVNARIEADPRFMELVAPLLEQPNPTFDPKRMVFGGFRALVSARQTGDC